MLKWPVAMVWALLVSLQTINAQVSDLGAALRAAEAEIVGVKLDDEARQTLLREAENLSAAKSISGPWQWWFESYLYELRDRAQMWASATGTVETSATTASADRDSIAPRHELPVSVDVVRRRTIQEYVETSTVGWTGRTPGRLVISSTPVGASIRIDGQAKGTTTRSFVVSPGSHIVSIIGQEDVRCARSVVVTEGETTNVKCP